MDPRMDNDIKKINVKVTVTMSGLWRVIIMNATSVSTCFDLRIFGVMLNINMITYIGIYIVSLCLSSNMEDGRLVGHFVR